MRQETVIEQAPRKIAGKFLGGFVPAVSYHFGVLEVLEGAGFRLRSGFLEPGEERQEGPPGIDLVVGSSAGAFFVTAACAGVGREELLGSERAIEAGRQPFDPAYLGEGKGLTGKTLEWFREGPRTSWANRRSWKSWAAENTLNVLLPLWRLDAMEEYLRDEVLRGHDWTDLKTDASILVVDVNHPVTLILGERESPILKLLRKEPVSSETVHLVLGSEGRKIVAAFEAAGVDPEHPALAPFRARPDVRNTAVYVRGVSMESAAAGSMAAYPFYAPVTLADRRGRPLRIGHYRPEVMDGEDRNPFTTDVAEESGADFVFVSSISTPYKYLHALGSLTDRGYSALHHQKSAHSRDAKQEDVIRAHDEHERLLRAACAILEDCDAPREAIEALEGEFQRIVWVRNRRIRITPDPDVAKENHILRRLDPLAFNEEAVQRAFDLGRMVAERVLKGYRFEFLG